MFFWKRPMKNKSDDAERLKSQTHHTADKAEDSIQRLNSLLRADGITLKIYKASHGQHR